MRLRIVPFLYLLAVLSTAELCSSQQGVGVGASQGISPSTVYEAGDFDNVNPATGNLFLDIPILSYPQLGHALRLSFHVYYNDKSWFIDNWPRAVASAGTSPWSYTQNNTATPLGVYVARDQHLGFGKDVNTLYSSQGNVTEP